MKGAEMQAIYIMWLRQMKHFIRSRSRIIFTIVQPLFYLFLLGAGLRYAALPGVTEGDYMDYFAPGVITMAILFSSLFTGVSVLWDKKFGFLQEVLVAPVSRLSIIIGKTLGGATTALIQGFVVLGIALGIGVHISNTTGLLLTLLFMIFIAFTAVGFGLIVASKLDDFQGFQLIMNLIILPLIFLSSAFYPIATNPLMPPWAITLSYLNPLFYMVDGLRGSLTGFNAALSPGIDLIIALFICIVMMAFGSYLFNKSEV